MEQIWAKSGKKRTLIDHTADVVTAFESLFGEAGVATRLGVCWQRFFKLNNYQSFWDATLAASLFHDLGKANDGFQNAVLRGGEQLIRHEHLSALLLGTDEVHKWVLTRPDIDWEVVLAAVLTHHLKASFDVNSKFHFAATSPNGTLIEVYIDHPDLIQLMQTIADRLHLGPKLPQINRFWSFDEKVGCHNIVLHRTNLTDGRLRSLDKQVGGRSPKNVERRRLLLAVRAALIAADSVGSAMPRTGYSISAWINDSVTRLPLCTDNFINTDIIECRINELRGKKAWKDDNGRNGWSEFQIQAGLLPDRALLLAPCGSGKTLAAWRWIAERCRRGIQRVIFLYPTRATATEGFRDYVSWAPEVDAALVHGSAEFDLDGMFENPDESDERREKSFFADARFYSLGVWPRRIFSATVDQFLGFLQYGYNQMLMLPLLADSVVVIDEVHSFDRSMFSSLKDFLREFDVPVLCMTATLPSERRRELSSDCGLTVYDEKPGELRTVSDSPRYRVKTVAENQLQKLINDKLSEGKRILWVVNQVRWAQQAFLNSISRRRSDAQQDDDPRIKSCLDALYVSTPQTENGTPVYCYHSRFRLKDRRDRHQQTVRAFQGNGTAALAVTTQVCEMSLDMDADVLITQAAPITALIQRMGRCNRVSKPRDGAGEIFIYEPENWRPYSDEDLLGVTDFVASLVSRGTVTQTDLEKAMSEFGSGAIAVPKASRFLESGPYAVANDESFRDIDEFTVRAVLDTDVDEFLLDQSRKNPTDGYLVPVPNQKRFFLEIDPRSKRLPNYLRIASHKHYHAVFGFYDTVISPDGDQI